MLLLLLALIIRIINDKKNKSQTLVKKTFYEFENNFDAEKIMGELNYFIEKIDEKWEQINFNIKHGVKSEKLTRNKALEYRDAAPVRIRTYAFGPAISIGSMFWVVTSLAFAFSALENEYFKNEYLVIQLSGVI